MLTKYPDVKIGKVAIGELPSGVLAETAAYASKSGGAALDGRSESLIISADFMRKTPEEAAQQFRYAESSKFFFPGSAADPYRQLVYHEYGHVVSNRGGRRTNPNVGRMMVDLFNRSGRAEPMPTEIPIDPHAELKIQSRDLLRNIDAREAWLKRNEQALSDWLNDERQVSGYSMVDQAMPGQLSLVTGQHGRILPNPGEAVAQAFSDVELRGNDAPSFSKALHDAVIDEYRKDWPTPDEATRAALRAPMKESAVEALRKATAAPVPWTDAEFAKEDNRDKNAAGKIILTAENRALAKQLAIETYQKAAAVEPAITAAAKSSVEHNGGHMSGLAHKLKEGPSLYRKIQAEAITIANGEPVDDNDIRQAAANIKDAVRYTGIMRAANYWPAGTELRKALESLGAKTIKDPIGVPLHGYRGRNMAFEYQGVKFEMQVNTKVGVQVKARAHEIYDKSRKLEQTLINKGVDPMTNARYVKMLDDMQAMWDSLPITKGTPLVQTEKDAKSGDLDKVIYVAEGTEHRGPTLDKAIYDTAKANGGITIDLEGDQPSDGYAYAPRKDTEVKILKSEMTPEDIDHYIDTHHELLSQRGNHLGLWEEGDYFYLDVSRVGSPTARTIAGAQANDQLGVYDLKHFATIDIGKIDERGNYARLGKAADLHAEHQRKFAGRDERASGASTSEVPERRTVTRYGPGGEWHSPWSLDPKDVPPSGIDFLDHQHLVDNVLARYNDTVGDKAWIRSAGEQWYPAARAWVLKMLDATGSDMDLDKASAIVAQYSENASWAANMARAMNYFTGKPTGAFKATDARTKAIAESDDPLSMVKGPKINNFVRAILGYDRFPDAVAVDRWAARIALGTDDKNVASKILDRAGGYEALADAYRDAARQLGIPPSELQAVTWVHAVPADAVVRAFKEAGEWHF